MVGVTTLGTACMAGKWMFPSFSRWRSLNRMAGNRHTTSVDSRAYTQTEPTLVMHLATHLEH